MAQTKKKRNRKRRGTQAGSIDTRKKPRPKNRAEARGQARSKSSGKNRGQKGDAPPTWGSAILRGIIASLVFVVLLVLLFKRSIGQALPIGAFLLVFYIPAGYYMDTVLWRRRERARIRAAGK